MKRHLLACTLAVAIALPPTTARADPLDDFARVILVALAVVAVAGAAVETVSGVAAYKNFKAHSNHESPSEGWEAAGFLGGLANVGIGTAFLINGLPETNMIDCPTLSPTGLPERFTATDTPGTCAYREPASTGAIVFGSVLIGFGAVVFASSVVALSGTTTKGAAASSPGSTPATVVLSLPLMTF